MYKYIYICIIYTLSVQIKVTPNYRYVFILLTFFRGFVKIWNLRLYKLLLRFSIFLPTSKNKLSWRFPLWKLFFFVKIKSARESRFLPFFDFFHETLCGFHAHFLTLFHGHSKFFTDAFLDIFTGGFSFSWTWYSEIVRIFTETTFSFHGYRKKINFTKFHGKSKLYFSRTHVSIFTYVI